MRNAMPTSWYLGALALAACPSTPPAPAPSSAGKPDTLPTTASLALFPQSPFHTPVPATAALHPNSATLAQSLVDSEHFVLMVRQYTMPVFFADASTPRAAVPLTCAEDWELGVTRMAAVPIPPFAEAGEDDPSDPPIGCGTESSSDNLLTVVDRAGGCVYDFWQARRASNGTWEASWMAAHPLEGDGILPQGLSARASGFAYLMGSVWPEEVAAGEIQHAIAVSYPYTRAGGPVAPATDSDGITEADSAIPIGARFRLAPDLDLDSLDIEPHERTIAKALQTYGAFVVDTGGDAGIGIYGIDPRSTSGNAWAGIVPDEDLLYLDGIPLEKLEVLEFGPQDPNYDVQLSSNRCSTFE